MFQDLNWVRLTPDRAARGGTKTGLHTFQQQPMNDVRSLTGGFIYNGYWQRDVNNLQYPNPQFPNAGDTVCFAIHGYTYPSLLDPAAAPGITVLGHQLGAFDGTGIAHVWDWTNNAYRAKRSTTNQRGVFNTINQRCFFGDGVGEAMIFDDRTPAIHAQKNQTLGIAAPTQAMTPVGGGLSQLQTAGSGYCSKSSAYINSPNPNNLISTILTTDTVSVAGPNGGGAASGAVTVAGVSSNNVAFTATGTISITTGTSLVTLSGATWPANAAYCGLAINFNGYSFVIAETNQASNSWDIDGNSIGLSNVQLLIMGVYDGPTVTGLPYTITGSQVKLTTAAASTTPSGGSLGYAQLTTSDLLPVIVLATRANGLYRNLGNISLGPAGGGTPSTITDALMGAGVKDLGTVASQPWVLSDVGKTMVLDTGVGTLFISTVTAWVTASFVRLADANPGALINTKRAWWGTGLVGCGDAAMDNNVTATLTSATSAFTSGDVGKTIMVGGAGAAGAALYTTIIGWISATQVTLAAKNTSGGAISGKQAQWGAGTTGATVGPTYAYAWYDPETGHMSNISPTYQVPKPTIVPANFADLANLTPSFQVDPGLMAYPNATDAVRFSHIVFFRTLSTGGSTLYPIGSLQPFVGKVHPGSASTRGSWNPTLLGGWAGVPNQWVSSTLGAGQIWYDFSSDADLILSGGFRAPQFTNTKPMATIRGGGTQAAYPYLMAYWDRRLWLISTQEPDKLLFSCDDAQCPLGVPEESFPATNALRLPSVDTKGMGLRTAGGQLILTTNRWAYTVAGNNESNYRLMKISSAMPGVGTYQMDEFPTYSGGENDPVTLFYLGIDRKVYQWTVGGPHVPISGPIQDQLDAAFVSYQTFLSPNVAYGYLWSTVHCVTAWGRRLVSVAMYRAESHTSTNAFLYDVDNQTWSTTYPTPASGGMSIGINPTTTIYGSNTLPVNEIIVTQAENTNTLQVNSWLRDDVALCITPITLTTFPMNFDGKKTRKQLCSVNLHATAGSYTGSVTINEGPPVPITFGSYPDPLDSVYAPSATPVDSGAADLVVMPGQFQTNGSPMLGYRFAITVTRTDANPAKIYALDVGYKVVEQVGDGDA